MTPQAFLDFNEELHFESFAGGGGASVGYRMFSGRDVDAACNHKPPAIWMHRANHRRTFHQCEDVFAIDLLKLLERFGNRRVGSWWLSPDCRHFSKAKGGALIDKRIRGLAWLLAKIVGVGGGRRHENRRGPACPRVAYLENVEEFQTWGPLIAKRCPVTGRVVKVDGSVAAPGEQVPLREQWLVPDPKRTGKYFNELVKELTARGGKVEWRTSRASSFGANTIRKRLMMMVRFDGRPIVWPEATHGPGRKPLRMAAEVIDFSDLGHSIIHIGRAEAKKLRIQRPLAKASNVRFAKGVDKFVIKSASPFIINFTHQGGDRTESVFDPMKTITAARRGEKAVVFPHIAHAQHGGASRSATEPMHTICASKKDQNQVVFAHVARQFKTAVGHPISEPMRTAMTKGGGGKSQLVACHVAQQFGQSIGRAMEDPAPTITAGGMGKTQVVSTLLAQRNTGVVGRATDEPFSTITAKGTQQALVACYIVKYYGTEQAPEITEPLHTVTTKDRFGLSFADLGIPPLTPELAEKARRVAAWLRENGVEVEGEFAMCGDLVIYDISMRMFKPRELYRAQGFPDDYIIEYGINEDGDIVPLTKTQQIEMCGNSVSPIWAAAHYAANNPEMRSWEFKERRAA